MSRPATTAFAPAARGVRRGELFFSGTQAALSADGSLLGAGDVRAQADAVLARLAELLADHGGSLADVVSLTSFHADPRSIGDVLDVARGRFAEDFPAWTPVGFLGCEHPGALVVMRAIAHLGDGPKRCTRPAPHEWLHAYPVSAACRKGELLFVAGQAGVGPDGEPQLPLDHCVQARGAYARIEELLHGAGATIDDVLDFTSFHLDIRGALATRDSVYNPDVIGSATPCRDAATTSHVGSTGLARPGMLGTYSAIADVTPGRRQGSDPDAIRWDRGSPIAAATRKPGGSLVTVSGLVATDDQGAFVARGDVAGQVRHILGAMDASLGELGLALDDVTEVVSFHKDPRCHAAVMEVAGERFDRDRPPAWSFVGSPGLWFEELQCEIAAFAVPR